MENKVNQIAIIQKSNSYIINSLISRLNGAGNKAFSVYAEPEAVNSRTEKADVILLYLESALLNDHITMGYIRDLSAERNQMIFLIGDESEVAHAKKIIPKRKIVKTFLRPIDVGDVANSIAMVLQLGVKAIKKKVLVVDDSGAMLRNVKGWLSDKYEVILVNSGELALKYLASNEPDLVLLDYEMPNMDGREVLKAIRANPKTSELMVVFLTSKGDKEDVMEVMSLKPAGYILKTEQPEKIVERIDSYFNFGE